MDDAALDRFDFVFNHNLFYPIVELLIAQHASRSRGRWARAQGLSLCSALNHRFPDSLDVRMADQSRVVAEDHPRDSGVVIRAAQL